MKVFLKEEKAGARVVCLGMFDGMHRGHQALIRLAGIAANHYGAKVRVITFDRHPMEILKPEAVPKQLTGIPEKADLLAEMKVDELEILPFTRETAEMAPETFLRRLRERVDVKAVVVGWNYTFGQGGSGNADTLRADARKHGYQAIVMPAVRRKEEVVSASRIRELLEEGQTDSVRDMLCRHYTLKGTAVSGKQTEGETVLPTVTLRVWEKKMLPGAGVYACLLEDAELNTGRGFLTIGEAEKPGSGEKTAEVHVIGEETAAPGGLTELRGKKVRVTVLRKIRAERNFGTGEERLEQTRRDLEAAKSFFGMG